MKVPLTREDCETAEEKGAWTQRRKRLERMEVEVDKLDVDFDKNAYLKMVNRR